MKIRFLPIIAIIGCIMLMASAAVVQAVPLLQLYIDGGTYDTVTETIVTDSDTFTLAALLTVNGTVVDDNGTVEEANSRIDWLSLPYYISVALVPQTDTQMNLGTVDFGSDTINVTGDGTDPMDMVYGQPPLDGYLANKDLPTHDIFDTYYYETQPFYFLETQVTPTFNTQDAAMDGYITPDSSNVSYYLKWEVDVSNLDPEYDIHFDLYNLTSQIEIAKRDRVQIKDIKVFAPFSHDAGTTTVPEPGTLVLLGIGMLGVAAYRRKMN